MATPATGARPVATRDPSRSGDRRLRLDDILKLMAADGLVPRADADKLARARTRQYEHPLELVAAQHWKSAKAPHAPLTLEWLVEWLAGKLGVPYRHIDPLKIDLTAVTSTMSNAYAERFRILPVEVAAGRLVVATSEPFVTSWAKELSAILKLDVALEFANPVDIKRYLGEFYNLARSMKKAAEAQPGQVSLARNFEQLVELGKRGALDANDSHVVHITDWLWQYAFEQRASDIHIEPRRDVGLVRFRIDGVLHQVYAIPTPVLVAMTSRIKLLARMEIVEKRRPQDGRIKTVTPGGQEVELRIATMPTAFGEKIVMRIFTPEVLVRDYADLGFTPDDTARWEQMAREPHGIILVTGPTGSGKTTTLYSTLRQLATPEVNVCTIEDPIEMIEPALNQMQVQPSIGVDFASGVRTLLRQDPDIIMVGEIRDRDTAEMAVQAALTGHLVLSTLHTNDAPTAVTRLLDLGVPAYLINSTLLGVMAQRLVRTLCPHCKRPGEPPEPEIWSMITAPWRVERPASGTMDPVGCLECRMTGYLGRIGLYEIMLMTPALRKLVDDHADDVRVREQAYKDGMRPLRVSGAIKVAAGISTADEVMKVAPLG
ncbi:MAG: Flp pilus assembly complex ATPase component TadA [Burkholderiales bacterium]|nr:Flp pilus assembly complex ATPase component TadA [Burkholderiales bacterium]